MKKNKRIFAFHLLNDRSGSPKVLSQIVKGWIKEEREVWICTSLHQDGFLSHIQGVQYINGWYRFKTNPWIRLIYFTISQLLLFFKLLFIIKKSDIIYINTILPFGAALLGKLKGCHVIYHIHESTINPALLKWFLIKVAKWTADDMIHVSKYVAKANAINYASNHLVYNSIDNDFLNQAVPKALKSKPRNVLMVCSLKVYKGIYEFIHLAEDNAQYQFRLVINASQNEIDTFMDGIKVPENTILYPAQKNLHPFFQWADIVVNLSRPDRWIETFGLTIVEGMAYGLPALVPNIGGISEVIEEGVTGFGVDSRNRKLLNSKLKALMENPDLYMLFSKAAIERLKHFQEQTMLEKINKIVW